MQMEIKWFNSWTHSEKMQTLQTEKQTEKKKTCCSLMVLSTTLPCRLVEMLISIFNDKIYILWAWIQRQLNDFFHVQSSLVF